MKNRILVIAFMLFGVTTFNAKALIKFGVRAEANMIHVGFSRADLDPINFKGFSIGPVLDISLPLISVETGLLYSHQDLTFADLDEEGYGLNTDRAYLVIPAIAKYKIGLGEMASIYLGAGPDISFRLQGNDISDKVSGVLNDYSEKKFSAGLNLAAGVMLFSHLQFGINYRWGLVDEYSTFKFSDLATKDGISGKPTTFSITASVFF
jgi:hypothetical protein